MTAALAAAAAALTLITSTALYLRRRPVWQGPGQRTRGSAPRPPRQHPAPRDWGQSRLPSAADRTAQFAAISDEAARPQPPAEFFSCLESHIPEIPCAACGYDQRRPVDREAEGSADLDQFLPAGLYPQTLAPLPDREQQKPHACGDMPEGRVHAGCEISDTGQMAALTALNVELPPAGAAGLGTRPGEDCGDVSGEFTCTRPAGHDGVHEDSRHGTPDYDPPAWGDAPVGTAMDWDRVSRLHPGWTTSEIAAEVRRLSPRAEPELRCASCDADRQDIGIAATCTCPPEPAGNAAARWHLKAHVGYVMKRKPPLREYVEATIGPGVADLNPAYERDAAAITVPPAEDFDRVLATARAVSDGE